MYNGALEDQEISDCFRKINIYPGETKDSLGRQRFFHDSYLQYFKNTLFIIGFIFWA
jgi:hypothetical protein